jgi:hypothetical protein
VHYTCPARGPAARKAASCPAAEQGPTVSARQLKAKPIKTKRKLPAVGRPPSKHASSRGPTHARVVHGEGERVAERVVHVRLCGKVHDRVDLLRVKHIAQQVGALQVALDELQGSGGNGLLYHPVEGAAQSIHQSLRGPGWNPEHLVMLKRILVGPPLGVHTGTLHWRTARPTPGANTPACSDEEAPILQARCSEPPHTLKLRFSQMSFRLFSVAQ